MADSGRRIERQNIDLGKVQAAFAAGHRQEAILKKVGLSRHGWFKFLARNKLKVISTLTSEDMIEDRPLDDIFH